MNKFKIVDKESGNWNLGEFETMEEAEKMFEFEKKEGVLNDGSDNEFEIVKI